MFNIPSKRGEQAVRVTVYSSRFKRDASGRIHPHEREDYTRTVKTILNGSPRLHIGQVLPKLEDRLPRGVVWRIEVRSAPPAKHVRAHIVKRFKAHLRHPRVVDGSDVLVEFVDE